MTPNKPVIARWTAALTSGDYEQGGGSLRRIRAVHSRATAFCCFGVLCELYAEDHLEAGWTAPSDYRHDFGTQGFFFDLEAQPVRGLAPNRVMQWAGLTAAFERLVTMNDSGRTFLEIAQEIDRLVAIGE